jgi:hypothetical protein
MAQSVFPMNIAPSLTAEAGVWRFRWWIVLLVGIAGLLYWFSRLPNELTLRFVEFRVVNGERCGVFALQNETKDRDLCYLGRPGMPEFHFRLEGGARNLSGPGPVPSNTLQHLNVLRPGEQIEFIARMWLAPYHREVDAPFALAVKTTSKERFARSTWLQRLQFPRRFQPDVMKLIWSETITP